MSSLAQTEHGLGTLVTWSEFLLLPERPENGIRYELHDGEVVVAPPPRNIHIKLQKRLEKLLEGLAGDWGVVMVEFPYRPVVNYQYWCADVAYILRADWDALPLYEYVVCVPALIVEILSPSNTPAKVSRQRITAMSAGTQVFLVIDSEKRTILVTDPTGTKLYGPGEVIPLHIFDGAVLAVDEIFAI